MSFAINATRVKPFVFAAKSRSSMRKLCFFSKKTLTGWRLLMWPAHRAGLRLRAFKKEHENKI
jgi:hypothetical protein